jgi:hypothetical protein
MQKCLGMPPDSGQFNPLEAPFTPGRGPGRLIRPNEAQERIRIDIYVPRCYNTNQ